MRNILKAELANAVIEVCKNLYEKSGVSAVTDYCNKIGLNYGSCKACEAEMPVIQTVTLNQCACCGQEIAEGEKPTKSIEGIIQILEANGISVDEYEEDDKLCGYELNTYTDGGVNQIIFLDLRGVILDATNPDDVINVLAERINSIDIDDEIDVNRQDKAYKAAFTLSEAVVDFTDWKEKLEKIVKEIQTLT